MSAAPCIFRNFPPLENFFVELVYDRNRSFGGFRPNRFGRSFGGTCRTTESAKYADFSAKLRQKLRENLFLK